MKKIEKKRYIEKIVKCFRVEKIRKIDYSQFLELYKSKVIELLDREVKTRQELTEVIDLVNEYSLTFSRYEPAVGTLMRGTIWHILNAIYLSLHKTDLKNYSKMVELLKNRIKKYKID